MKIYTSTQNNRFEFESQENNGESFLSLNGKKLNIKFKQLSNNRYLLIKDNQPCRINIVKSDEGYGVSVNGSFFQVAVEDERSRKMKELVNLHHSGQSEKVIKAQIPGLIVDVSVNVGSTVKSGEPMLILEAMKMENIIKAPFDCEIVEIKVAPKETVNQNQPMLKIKSI